MSKFRKLMAAAALLFAASAALVGCSDDDNKTMGPIGINSLQSTSTTVTLYWTIVPNSNCDGYNVSIVEGTRANKGAVVVSQDFENRTAKGTFTGLKQNTSYVAITKGIPSKSSGFKDAYTYEFEFVTAPLVQNITTSPVTYEANATAGSVTATWTALTGNAASYTVALYKKNGTAWTSVNNATISNLATASKTFSKLVTPGTTYRVGVRPNPSNADWYAAGEWEYSPEFTAPAAN